MLHIGTYLADEIKLVLDVLQSLQKCMHVSNKGFYVSRPIPVGNYDGSSGSCERLHTGQGWCMKSPSYFGEIEKGNAITLVCSINFLLDNTFWKVVSAAVEQFRCKDGMIA